MFTQFGRKSLVLGHLEFFYSHSETDFTLDSLCLTFYTTPDYVPASNLINNLLTTFIQHLGSVKLFDYFTSSVTEISSPAEREKIEKAVKNITTGAVAKQTLTDQMSYPYEKAKDYLLAYSPAFRILGLAQFFDNARKSGNISVSVADTLMLSFIHNLGDIPHLEFHTVMFYDFVIVYKNFNFTKATELSSGFFETVYIPRLKLLDMSVDVGELVVLDATFILVGRSFKQHQKLIEECVNRLEGSKSIFLPELRSFIQRFTKDDLRSAVNTYVLQRKLQLKVREKYKSFYPHQNLIDTFLNRVVLGIYFKNLSGATLLAGKLYALYKLFVPRIIELWTYCVGLFFAILSTAPFVTQYNYVNSSGAKIAVYDPIKYYMPIAVVFFVNILVNWVAPFIPFKKLYSWQKTVVDFNLKNKLIFVSIFAGLVLVITVVNFLVNTSLSNYFLYETNK